MSDSDRYLRYACFTRVHVEAIVPLHSYGVLKGKAIEVRLGARQSPHYQVHIVDDITDYRARGLGAARRSETAATADRHNRRRGASGRAGTPAARALEQGRGDYAARRARAGSRRCRVHQGAGAEPRLDARVLTLT
jgi:hypothetical protein